MQINKDTKRQFSRRNFILPDGDSVPLKCEHRIRFCSKGQLANDFMESELFKELKREGYSISERKAQACICYCIKEVRT